MALNTKINVPLEPMPAGQIGDETNFYDEVNKIQELAAATANGISTEGNVAWTSRTSGITYNTEDPNYSEVENVEGNGNLGLLNLLIYLYGTSLNSTKRFLMTAEDWNSVVELLVAYNNGDRAVAASDYAAYAGRIGSSATYHPQVGGPEQPVYVNNNGEVVSATRYSNANVSHAVTAEKLGTTTVDTAVGDVSTPIYFAGGIPQRCTSVVAAKAGVADKLGNGTVGSLSQPIYLNNGIPTPCNSVVAASASNAATADALANGRTLQVDLTKTGASTEFNGTNNITDIGVVGTLPVRNGGTGVSSTQGSFNRPVYLGPNRIQECAYLLNATVNSSGASDFTNPPLAAYSSSNNIVSLSRTIGNATQPVYVDNGVVTACTTSVASGANFNNKLAFYSSNTGITAYNSNVGSKQQLMYLQNGIPTAGINITYGTGDPPATANVGDIYIKIQG